MQLNANKEFQQYSVANLIIFVNKSRATEMSACGFIFANAHYPLRTRASYLVLCIHNLC